MTTRYDGKPLLRLVELYILWTIGEISDADETRLREMTPKLQSLYGVGGSWQEVIATAVGIPAEAAAALRDMWSRNVALAQQNSVLLTPQRFAEMVADENFSGS